VRPVPPRFLVTLLWAALLLVSTGPVAGAEESVRLAQVDGAESADAATTGAAPSDSERRTGLREVGFRVAYGYSTRQDVQVIPLYAHAGWWLPGFIDDPLARWNLALEYFLEGWIGGTTGGPQDAIEFGINPIGFKISYDAGQAVVPYFTGGIGVMYTGLGGLRLGGPFEFNETAGAGFELFPREDWAITLGFRYRHISNAGISDDNLGLDTLFGQIGLSYYPRR
jgi:lipid A 3-O-deacylase